MHTIQLGQKVRDRISGLQGIAVAVTDWLHGPRRVTIQPQSMHDGKAVDPQTFDEANCEILDPTSMFAEPSEVALAGGGSGGNRPRPTARAR